MNKEETAVTWRGDEHGRNRGVNEQGRNSSDLER